MQELSNKIELHYLRTRPDEDLQMKKEKLYHYIQQCVFKLQNAESDTKNKSRVLRHIKCELIDSSEWKIFKFGSESDGTSLPSSDIDLGVHVNFKNTRKDKEKLLYRLSKIISTDDKDDALLVKLILHARYPIIRVYHIYTHCTVNISISDRYCFQRNELIKQYLTYYNNLYSKWLGIDEFVKKLIVFIKKWSKIREINNAYQGYLNSFGFMMFTLKFLKWFTENKLYETWSEQYHKWSLAEILKAFYTFYVAKFDETQHSISIIDCYYDYDECKCDCKAGYGQNVYDEKDEEEQIFDKKWNKKCVLEVVDPVNFNHNVTKNVGYHEFEHIKYEFVRALQIFENQKDGLFDKLCKSTKESVAKYDIYGHVVYGTFIYSKEHDKDLRYKYDPNVHWVLTKVDDKTKQA